MQSPNTLFPSFFIQGGSLTPMRWPIVTEKPMDRAADPKRPFLLSSVTAKMQTTSCMVRKTSTVVAIPKLMPGCSWKWTRARTRVKV